MRRVNCVTFFVFLLLANWPGIQTSQSDSLLIEDFAGTGQAGYSGDGGPASQAQLNNPYGISRGPDGALYICDMENHVIRKVSRDGKITTVAGNGKRGYSGDGGPATAATLNEPYEIRCNKRGDLFFVERMNHVVRRVQNQFG